MLLCLSSRQWRSVFEEWAFGDDRLVAGSKGHYDQAEYDRQLEHGAG